MNDICLPDDKCCSPAAVAPRLASGSPEEDAELARIAKALGHPMRVRLLRLLVERRSCQCGELVAELPISQATVSQHLKVLKEAGLVRGEIDGLRACYCGNPERLERLLELLDLLRQPKSIQELEVAKV